MSFLLRFPNFAPAIATSLVVALLASEAPRWLAVLAAGLAVACSVALSIVPASNPPPPNISGALPLRPFREPPPPTPPPVSGRDV